MLFFYLLVFPKDTPVLEIPQLVGFHRQILICVDVFVVQRLGPASVYEPGSGTVCPR
jgi:hypothetical protein